MARARNIKPGFYKNEDLAECSIWARFIFPGLWMLADREGRLEDRPKRIKAELLPFDGEDVDALLNELQARGFLVRYRNSDGAFIQISAFKKHQTPHYSEKQSVIKPHVLQEDSGNSAHQGEQQTPRVLQEDSGSAPVIKGGSQPPDLLNPDSPNPDSPKRTHRVARAAKRPLPQDFSISERVKEWATSKGFDRLEEHLEAFRRKCSANSYAYADWDSAFMEAVREDWAKLRLGKQTYDFSKMDI